MAPEKRTYETTRFVPRPDGLENEVTFLAHVRRWPGRPGRASLRNGDPGYPPDPPEIEVERVDANVARRGRPEQWQDCTRILYLTNPGLLESIEADAIEQAEQDDWEADAIEQAAQGNWEADQETKE